MIGPDQIARFIASEMHRLFSEIDISFRAIHADGDTVIIEERMRATLPEGRPYDNDYCFVFVAIAHGRATQYSRGGVEPRGHGVLDFPASRGMTAGTYFRK